MPSFTLSGNEITDATRASALAWGTTQQGGSTDGATTPGGVGVWEAGTNLFRRGQCDATTDWNVNGTGTVSKAVDATTPAPFSPQSVKVTTGGIALGEGLDPTSATGQAAAAATVGVGSCWFKGVAGQSYQTRVFWANTDATFTSGTTLTFNATGAWQLIAPATVAVAVGKTGDSLRIRIATNTQRAENFWVSHAMLQKGVAVVSPYVATSGGATAARTAARVRAPATLIHETQGWVATRLLVAWNGTVWPSGTNPRIFDWNDDASHRLICFYSESLDKWTFDRYNVSNANAAAGSAPAPGDTVTVVAAWTAAKVRISINGAVFVETTNTSIPTLAATTFDIGSSSGTALFIDSNVLWVACGTGTLTNADAVNLNHYPTPPTLATLLNDIPDGVPTMSWAAVTAAYTTLTPSCISEPIIYA